MFSICRVYCAYSLPRAAGQGEASSAESSTITCSSIPWKCISGTDNGSKAFCQWKGEHFADEQLTLQL